MPQPVRKGLILGLLMAVLASVAAPAIISASTAVWDSKVSSSTFERFLIRDSVRAERDAEWKREQRELLLDVYCEDPTRRRQRKCQNLGR